MQKKCKSRFPARVTQFGTFSLHDWPALGAFLDHKVGLYTSIVYFLFFRTLNIENASVVAATAAGNADAQQDANAGGCGYSYTATEDLMVAKALFIRASEDRIKGSKQKVSLFKAKLASTYLLVKKEQENFEQKDVQHPNQLCIFNANNNGQPLDPYPAHTGNSIYQHFKGKIQPDVIKFISIHNQNPKLRGENDGDTYHIRLSTLFKEHEGHPFHFIVTCFLKDKPKFVVLIIDNNDVCGNTLSMVLGAVTSNLDQLRQV